MNPNPVRHLRRSDTQNRRYRTEQVRFYHWSWRKSDPYLKNRRFVADCFKCGHPLLGREGESPRSILSFATRKQAKDALHQHTKKFHQQ